MKNQKTYSGFTLIEMMIVVTIIIILAAVAIPNTGKLIRSQRMSSAENLIASAMSQARAHAIKKQTYAGIRFQFDTRGWQEGRQYAVLIEHNPLISGYAFTAIPNAKPLALPKGIALISGDIDKELLADRDAYLSNYDPFVTIDSGDWKYCMDYAATFSIVFSPTGQIANIRVYLQSRSAQDQLINYTGEFLLFKEIAGDAGGISTPAGYPLWALNPNPQNNSFLNDYRKTCTTHLYLANVDDLINVPENARYSELISNGKANDVLHLLFNYYTGELMDAEDFLR